MNKNLKYLLFILLPVLTAVVWLIWVFVIKSSKQDFLEKVGRSVEKVAYPEKKRRSRGLRIHTAKKSRK